MQLPGRLKATTLGDLLGALHRSHASGALELTEASGRVHRVHLACGLVTAVELDRASASLAEILRRDGAIDEDVLRRSLLRALASRRLHGEVLVREFHLSPELVDRALRRQLMVRLTVLEELADAQICFRAAVPKPRGALLDAPLAKGEFLAGRRRARERAYAVASGTFRSAMPRPPFAPSAWDPARERAFRALGLTYGAESDDVKRAYRRLVRTYHPDLHPDATHEERRSMEARFAEVTAAYRSLVA
jgi:DnaJ-domain-containing protein 1